MHQEIRAFSDKECGMGAAARDIDRAERRLGVELPESYREFLLSFGWARFAHQEVYGLGAEVPDHLDLIRNTIAERSQMGPSLPLELVPVMNDGAGNHWCLKTDIKRNGECPVVFWDHELGNGQHPELIASSFNIWLIQMLDELGLP